MGVSFKVSEPDFELIEKIVQRASESAVKTSIIGDLRPVSLMMDLIVVHANGCPLQLERMLKGPEFDFWHDLFGIIRNMNRRTGQLENSFVPRFAMVN